MHGEERIRPLIGIMAHSTADPDCVVLDGLLDQIVAGLARAGGRSVVMRAGLGPTTLASMLAEVDGLLYSGGGDVDPHTYGEAPRSRVAGVDPRRDQSELQIMRWAIREGKPLLAICRGMQILNVACGGTLYQDISEYPGAQRHTYYPGYPFDLLAHPIEITPASKLRQIIGGTTVAVNSLHHQACHTIGAQLAVVARAPDGMVEAIELPDHPFALAVQWHPEALPLMPEAQALFEAIVAQVRSKHV